MRGFELSIRSSGSRGEYLFFHRHAGLGAWVGVWTDAINMALGLVSKEAHGVCGMRRRFNILKRALCKQAVYGEGLYETVCAWLDCQRGPSATIFLSYPF
jgi:hypothetical protein